MMGLLDDELAKLKRSFGLLGELKLKNDPGVKKLDEFERKLYEKSMIYKSLKDAVTAPGRAYRGELDPYSPQAMEEAMNLAGAVGVSGMSVPMKAGPGTLGMFYGDGPSMSIDELATAPRRPVNHLGQEIPPTQYELLAKLLGNQAK